MEAAIVQTECELSNSPAKLDGSMDGLAICTVVGFQENLPILTFEIAGTIYTHKAIAFVGNSGYIDIGSQVCAAFDQSRCHRPIVLGKLSCDVAKKLISSHGTVIADDDQITLQCGKASIKLKSDGTVAIRGTNVASRASQTNRIRGGNVQIN
jgi:hypothetical protein